MTTPWNAPGVADDQRSTDQGMPDFVTGDQPDPYPHQASDAPGNQQPGMQSYRQPPAQNQQQQPREDYWQPSQAGYQHAEPQAFDPFSSAITFNPYADPNQSAPAQGQQLSPQSPPPYSPAAAYPGYSLAPLQPYSAGEQHPNGTVALVLGILGFFFGFTAPFAWWLGAAGRADVRKHPGRYSNEGALTAGMICGAIVTIGMAAMFALVLLALLLGAA